MTVITNVRLIMEGEILSNQSLVIREGKILDFFPSDSPVAASVYENAEVIDGEGLYLSPGFIDMHVHGGGGREVMELTSDAVIEMAEAHRKFGTTGIVPTTMAAPINILRNAIDAVREASETAKNILGIHLEGPYLSQEQRGAQRSDYILKPAPMDYEPLLTSWDKILMMGVAPEIDGTMEMADFMNKHGIVASVAHSNAEYTHMKEALNHGFCDITHFYSGCSNIRRENSYRYLGVVESGYLLDEYSVQIIADGKHLPSELIQLIYKVKGPDKISIITDALAFAACELTEGETHMQKNGVPVIYEDNVLKLTDRSGFAGSIGTMNKMVRNVVELAGIPLVHAVQMATATPAKVLGFGGKKGKIKVGYDTDLILFDDDINVKRVIMADEI